MTNPQTHIVILDWPVPQLWRNYQRSNHWSKYHKHIKAWRGAAAILCKVHKVPKMSAAKAICIHITHITPDGRKRDQEGVESSVKAYLDGIADWLGVDDSIFEISRTFQDEPEKHGRVKIEITEIV